MYLTIPNGMKYAQIIIKGEKKDFFIEKTKEASDFDLSRDKHVPLQEEVKDALRTIHNKQKVVKLKDFIIYRDVPPAQGSYLQYIPENNGATATTEEAKVVEGSSVKSKKCFPNQNSLFKQSWHLNTPLNTQRRAQVEKEREDQRHNRRHDGDSPKPT